ncbi:MAG: O-methyltransferase [Bacteroidota bacterium]
MDILSPDILAYIEKMGVPEPDLLARLRKETHQKVLYPRMLSGPYQGRLLALFSKILRPNHILEIGTFTGYSCICLAEGLAPSGQITTLEKNPELAFIIRPYLEEAGISDRVNLQFGDAKEVLPSLSGPFDLVFIDADKAHYVTYYQMVLSKLSPNGIILADNVLWSGKVLNPHILDKETDSLRQFNKFVQEDDKVEQVLLPIRDGLMLIRKKV